VLLGLEGRAPDRTEPELADVRVAAIRAGGRLELNGTHPPGLDMQTKYKQTSLGGLAVGVVEC
jgi:hypothetical protein